MDINYSRIKPHLTIAGKYVWPKGIVTSPGYRPYPFDNCLVFVHGGIGQIGTNYGPKKLKKGTIVWLKPGWSYNLTQHPEHPLTVYSAHFDLLDERGVIVKTENKLVPDYYTQIDTGLAESIFRQIVGDTPVNTGRNTFTDEERTFVEMLFAALLYQMDMLSSNKKTTVPLKKDSDGDDLLIQIAHQMAANPGEIKSILELSEIAMMSPSQFSHAFKKRYQQTPHEFLIYRRTLCAKRLLVETHLSIKEIAVKLGYNNLNFFHRQFKKIYQISPAAFRKQHHEKPDADK